MKQSKTKYPKYEAFSLRELYEQGHPEAEDWWNDDYYYRTGVFLLDYKGEPSKLIGYDGGEPEDQNLYRDFAWVVEALNKAWQNGYEHGINR